MPGFENYGIQFDKLVDPNYIPHFLELSEHSPDELSIFLDQHAVRPKNLTLDQQHRREHGYVIKRGFIPDSLIEEYIELRRKLNLGDNRFPTTTPHLNYSVIRDICCSRELHYLLVDLLGEEMGLTFSLNGFKSSERGWHQDDYLNPESLMGRYVAVWMAMDDIHPDSGPFEFVPGSHKWPCLRGDKVRAWVKPEARDDVHDWATAAEYFLNKSVERYTEELGAKPISFDAKKGDLLIWHAKLIHRGSIPRNPQLARPALISHYSSIRASRHIGPEITRHGDAGYFWEYSHIGEVLTEDKIERSDLAPAPDQLNGYLGRLWRRKGHVARNLAS